MNVISGWIKEYLDSKKGRAMIAGVIVALAGRIGLELDAGTVGLIVAPIVGYLIGQGMADVGKEAHIIDRDERRNEWGES